MTEAGNYIGMTKELIAAFTDINGNPIDPTAVNLYIKKPNQAYITYNYGVGNVIVKDSTGNYHANISLDVAGIWSYEWEGTGAAPADGEKRFYVYSRLTRG